MSWETSQEVLAGTEIPGDGGRGYLPLHCHHQNGSCIKMGSDESHFNVSLIVRDKVTTFEERGTSNRGPSAYQPNALPLGHTGSFGGRCNLAYFQLLGLSLIQSRISFPHSPLPSPPPTLFHTLCQAQGACGYLHGGRLHNPGGL